MMETTGDERRNEDDEERRASGTDRPKAAYGGDRRIVAFDGGSTDKGARAPKFNFAGFGQSAARAAPARFTFSGFASGSGTDGDKIGAGKPPGVAGVSPDVRKVDREYRDRGVVYLDYSALLNLQDFECRPLVNKFYVIQVIQDDSGFVLWRRWGRVGEKGQNARELFAIADDAVKAFKKRFMDKTRNEWSQRDDFKPWHGKYSLVTEEEDEDDFDLDAALMEMERHRHADKSRHFMPPAFSAEAKLHTLFKLILDVDMLSGAMRPFKIDTRKLPVGRLNTAQINKAFKILEELRAMVTNDASDSALGPVASSFYDEIPHDFGRQHRSLPNTLAMLQELFGMLAVLEDIEKAMSTCNVWRVNPSDQSVLDCDLEWTALSAERTMLETYLKTTGEPDGPKIIDIFKVIRRTEPARFAAHDSIDNRRLLWHGVNVERVAAILQSGLRISPHACGRAGRGLYFHSESSAAAARMRAHKGTGIMLLCEVPLGREYHITRDDVSLLAAPDGFDSVVCVGHVEPDPNMDIGFHCDKATVTVPQGRPCPRADGVGSAFAHTEYVVYREDQVRIRYLLQVKID